MTVRILQGDALAMLKTLPSESVQVCVTSPPYFGLRAYGTNPQVWGGDPEHEHEWSEISRRQHQPNTSGSSTLNPCPAKDNRVERGHGEIRQAHCPCSAWRGELGSEPTPALFIEHLVAIFDEVKRVLRSDGTCWVNIGDSYSGSNGNGYQQTKDAVNRTSGIEGNFSLRHLTGRRDGGGRMRLRSDLSPEQVAYVLSEMAKARSISDATQEGRE